MKAVVIAIVLLAAARAEADDGGSGPGLAWWEQFYVYAGYRDVDGLDRASGRTLAIGYRFERAGWGLDVALLDHVDGLDEGLHQLFRVAGYGTWRNLLAGSSVWLGGGLSYALLDGWTQTAVPHRSGHGIALDLIAGVDLPGWSIFRPFVHLDVSVPTFAARDRYGSGDSMERVVGIELAIGLRL